MNLINKSLRCFVFLAAIVIQAQEIPPIHIFSPQDYNAEDQNWGISQSPNGFIYVANNKGLLEYNGESWRLFNSPNNGIVRSVKVIGNKIYTGSYREFGFWVKNSYGELDYTSLSTNDAFTIQEDEEFWGIISNKDYILFQSFERIYIYNTTDDSFNIIHSDQRINKIFSVDDHIYFQKSNLGIFRIENGNEKLYIPLAQIGNKEIVNIYPYDGGLLMQTRDSGFFTFKENTLVPWQIAADDILSKVSVYSSLQLGDGSFVFGTISNGIYHLDKDGSILLNIDQASGLSNNTVLSIKEDFSGNVWLGLDDGINLLNFDSPYRVYKDKQGTLGTVYASERTDNYIYLGTNQGLFYKDLNNESAFKFVDGTQGQVWSLSILKGLLFCGHDNGTFIIKDNKAEKISSIKGTWGIKEVEGYPDLLIQSNYKGLSVLKNIEGDIWRYRNKIEGFDISSRYFEFSSTNEILVSHEHKGVYRIEIDSSFQKVLFYEKIDITEGMKSSILKYDGDILYSVKDGVFRYERDENKFKRDTLLSSVFAAEKYISGKMVYDIENERLWGFTNDEIVYIEPETLSGKLEANSVVLSSEMRKSKVGYENILNIVKDKYLIGTTDGYLIFDISKLDNSPQTIFLNSGSYYSLRNEVLHLNLMEDTSLKNKDNSIRFKYSVANYSKLVTSLYQYRLLGIYEDWSDWTHESEVFFENLPYGEYTFEVRAKTGGVLSANQLSYSFNIDKPWYLKPLAIVVYILLFVIGVYAVHFLNKQHYKKKEEQLLRRKERELELEQSENKRQLMQFKNENLHLDIQNKNRELGLATMNLVKRNELLNNIKDELIKSKSPTDVKRVIKLINSSLNNTNDWKLFEEAFNNVDKDFMKRIKTNHPSITPNDLRLCAYLRLNLSSKEIAPLLNISHKSVEVKRYRLRKKMGLDHNQSLSSYIIDL